MDHPMNRLVAHPLKAVGDHVFSSRVRAVPFPGAVEKETRLALTPDNFDVLLCGNPGMIDSMIVWAEARGFTRASGDEVGTLHAEKYW
jgi:hypothetical protein